MKHIAIIGGGAAGLMASIIASNVDTTVTLYEQNSEPGKKILASGNGRCNIINTSATPDDFSGEHPAFVSYALDQMPFKRFERFCRSIGLLLDPLDDGRCYPLNHEARAVQSALWRNAQMHNVDLRTNATVLTIEKKERFHVQTASHTDIFDAVLIATGSPAAPQLGGSDSGMHFARTLGHHVINPYPSLVQLHLEHPELSKMQGVKTAATVTAMIDGIALYPIVGDILFTKYGISGFAILDLSQQVSWALSRYSSVELQIDLLPNFTAKQLTDTLHAMASNLPGYTIGQLLEGLLPRKTIVPLLKDASVDADTPCRDMGIKAFKKVVYTLKQWRFHVTDTHGFKHAEVAGGGIDTTQIDPHTMESLIVPGLYFAGEVIDIVGRRGGFNFHFAWASASLAARSMIKI